MRRSDTFEPTAKIETRGLRSDCKVWDGIALHATARSENCFLRPDHPVLGDTMIIHRTSLTALSRNGHPLLIST